MRTWVSRAPRSSPTRSDFPFHKGIHMGTMTIKATLTS